MEENKKKKRTAGDVIRTLIMIVALGVFCYSGYQLLSIYQEYKKGSDEYHALENKYIDEKGMFEEINTDAAEPTMKNPIDFAGLKAVNEDIIAWLKVGAIDISYPVTQGKDNDYYLHNTFENQPNIAGCIFMDHGCKKDFSDPNTIIYGHNMRNLSMFGKLKQFRDQAVFDSEHISGYIRRRRFINTKFSPARKSVRQAKPISFSFPTKRNFKNISIPVLNVPF